MRLWSIHPAILDQKGLGGAWREGLLAQSVIVRLANGEKPGYRNHPQMARFLAAREPLAAIGAYLLSLHTEATSRGYTYNKDKILELDGKVELIVTSRQLEYEHKHILAKLKERSPEDYKYFSDSKPMPGAMFRVVSGGIEEWEKIQ